MIDATCKIITLSKFRVQNATPAGDDRIEGIDTPNPAVYPQFGHAAGAIFML